MLKFIACLCLAVAASTPLWSQVEPSASGGGFDLDDEHMMTPPPVSRDAYPVMVGSEERSNFLSGGLVFTAAYSDNLMLVNNSGPISDETYTFLPTIGLERRTPKQGESLHYSSGFALYQNTSKLNSVSQDGSAGYRFHLSPYAVISINDTFQQNYNLYNQGNPFAGGGVSGSPSSPNALIAPFANQLGNSTNAGIDYQYGRNAMIGGSAAYSFMQYSNLSDVPGLNNQDTTDGNAFFARRIARSQYVGLTYQFSKFITHPIDTYTVSNTVFGFYTHYFTNRFSLSILGGPEHYTTWTQTVAKQGAWTPAIQGSIGWQRQHTNLSASLSHVVTGAGGLIGTYHSNVGSLNGQIALSQTWGAEAHVDYMQFKNVHPNASQFSAYAGGHTVTGGTSVQHRITEKIYMEAGYQHFHQSYGNIAVASSFLGSNRAYGSISYQFSRPLGR
ncbi:MAG TPA: hypothetical protein VN753_09090 [Terracidiphilus sp.]|nr:hypothetical protein [Terracidiphilus sp.]